MSTKGNAVDHNVILPLKSTTLTIANSVTTKSTTVTGTLNGAGEFLDVSGWADKVIALTIADAGTPPAWNIKLQISDQHYYELNNKASLTAGVDYQTVNAYTTLQTGKGYLRLDGADVEELQRPIRSLRPVVFVSQSLASATTTGTKSTVVPATDKLVVGRLAVEGIS